MPKFVTLFKYAKIELPWPTRMCIVMSNAIAAYWPIGLTVAVLFVVGLITYCKTPGSYNFV